MTALILVVDDVPANVKLLEAKLLGEYYDVITAKDGFEAIDQARKHKPDIILLDVMMPGMDGFETCRRLKDDPDTSHIPVVMVTALNEKADRVNGLEAGADDFTTKPVNDAALFARIKSLVRIKVLMDEIRLRDKTGADMGIISNGENSFTADVSGSKIILIDDDIAQGKHLFDKLSEYYTVTLVDNPSEVESTIEQNRGAIDLLIISTQLADFDGLRLASHMRNMDAVRNIPIIMLIEEDDQRLMLKGLDLGINDYLLMPVDYNEMFARVKTQIRRRKYQEMLKANYQASISMAITDKLTGLYNRHYLDTHLQNTVTQSLQTKKPLSLLILDMDFFKLVNDTYGHDVGDEVLKQLSGMIIDATRSSDLIARIGGEEFMVVMPETDTLQAYDTAERIRRRVENSPFKISHADGFISKTVSIGVSTLNLHGDTVVDLAKRADLSLYDAKHTGRNRVLPQPASERPVVEKVDTGF